MGDGGWGDLTFGSFRQKTIEESDTVLESTFPSPTVHEEKKEICFFSSEL